MNTDEMRRFIEAATWTTARSGDHQYVVKHRLAPELKELFEPIVVYVRERGYRERFGLRTYTYYEPGDGHRYWTMGDPLETTWILNRAVVKERQPGQQTLPLDERSSDD